MSERDECNDKSGRKSWSKLQVQLWVSKKKKKNLINDTKKTKQKKQWQRKIPSSIVNLKGKIFYSGLKLFFFIDKYMVIKLTNLTPEIESQIVK